MTFGVVKVWRDETICMRDDCSADGGEVNGSAVVAGAAQAEETAAKKLVGCDAATGERRSIMVFFTALLLPTSQ